MKKILTTIFCASAFILQAQFTFKGTINDYPNQRVIVKLDTAFDNILVGNTTTDKNGVFSVPIKEKYTGIIEVSLLDAKRSLAFISDNTNINFAITLNTEGYTLDKPGNQTNENYRDYLNYQSKKNSVLPQLESIQSSYKPSDNFYTALKSEIQNISTLKQPDLTNQAFLSYYLNASELLRSTENSQNSLDTQNQILDHLQNSGEEFETAGLGRSLLYNYFMAAGLGAKTQGEWASKIDTSVERLLSEIGEDTSRGQEILAASINFLNSYGIEDIANKYMKRAESLTCEITPELKKTIDKNNNIKEGKTIANFKFTKKIEGKYSSLYDIKTKYKLIMVWASWCSHCRQELSSMKLFYDNFKKSGGEIIALSIDYDKDEWENAISGTTWINDSDLLYWDSKFAKELNISGTPTLFLVDQNNKILKIGSKISDINNLIK